MSTVRLSEEPFDDLPTANEVTNPAGGRRVRFTKGPFVDLTGTVVGCRDHGRLLIALDDSDGVFVCIDDHVVQPVD